MENTELNIRQIAEVCYENIRTYKKVRGIAVDLPWDEISEPVRQELIDRVKLIRSTPLSEIKDLSTNIQLSASIIYVLAPPHNQD